MASKNGLTWRHGLIALAVLGGGAYLLKGRNPAPPEPAAVSSPEAAKPCALRYVSTPDTRVLLFPTENGLDAYLKTAAAADLDASRVARDTNGGFVVEPGTKCSLVERNGDKAKVRITEGESRDKMAWTTVETTGT